MHARVTFGHGRPGLAGHLKSAATIAAGWLVTSGAVGALAVLRPGAGLVLQQTVYLSATALVGIGRYLVLRLAVFTEGAPQHRTGNQVHATKSIAEQGNLVHPLPPESATSNGRERPICACAVPSSAAEARADAGKPWRPADAHLALLAQSV
ncbi:hypothetical protein ACUXZZ_44095 [Streptomyces graminifolii]|uniref:hypothetical protein n=1 Tax=Streptomyces graminifolii TaxID=1266771 RepID=UPI004058242C